MRNENKLIWEAFDAPSEDAESSMGTIEKGKIESIVHSYSEYGVIDEVEKMIEDIKELVKREIRDCAEHVDDAVNCIDNL